MGEKVLAPGKVPLVFGENIKRARLAKNLTLAELARIIHYDRICLANIESGDQRVKFNTAINLARTLDVPFADLFSREFMSHYKEQDVSGETGYIEDEYLTIFTENLRKRIKEKRIKQAAMSEKTRISEAVISRLMKGKSKNPTLHILNLLAFASDQEIAALFRRTN